MESINATKLTIYIGDSDKHGRKPLHLAIVKFLYDEGILGATVLHGIKGYGLHKQIHKPGSWTSPETCLRSS